MARILLIEDDPELRSVLETLLRSEAHEVAAVESGELALKEVQKNSFDLIISDIRMDGMSGLDAIEKVQEDYSDIRTLVVTGYASEEDCIRAVSLGVEAYLKKPFSLDELVAAVNRALLAQEKERAEQAQRASLSSSFQWSLTALCRLIEQFPKAPPLSQLEKYTERICDSLGISDSIRTASIIVTLYLGVRDHLSTLMVEQQPTFPRNVEHALNCLDEWFDGTGQPKGLAGKGIPLAARIAQVVHARVCEVSSKTELEQLSESSPGRFDPHLVKILLNPNPETPKQTVVDTQAQRNFLSLAKTFEDSGNLASARQTYQQVFDFGPSRFALEASLAIVRLDARSGNVSPRKIQEGARRTRTIGETVGAAPTGWVNLELALLLDEVGLADDSIETLQLAKETFSNVSSKVGQAAVLLGEVVLELLKPEPNVIEAALRVLLQSSFGSSLSHLMYRLLPLLLGRQDSGLEDLTEKVVRDFSDEVLWLVQERYLKDPAKIRLCQILAKYRIPSRETLLEFLKVDRSEQVRQAAERAAKTHSNSINVTGPTLRVRSFGQLSVYLDNQRVLETEWRSQKTKYLLAMLAAAGTSPVSEDKILESFWPESGQKGRNCLYWSTSILRKILKQKGADLDPIIRTSSGLQLNPDLRLWHDLALFNELVTSVRSGDTNAYNIEDYLHVLQLYRGPYLEGAYFDWVVTQRHQLEVRAADLLTRFVSWTIKRKMFSNTLEYAQRLIEIEPSSELGHTAVMRSYIGLARYEQAIEHFHMTESLLKRDYDSEPSLELIKLHHMAKIAHDDRSSPSFVDTQDLH